MYKYSTYSYIHTYIHTDGSKFVACDFVTLLPQGSLWFGLALLCQYGLDGIGPLASDLQIEKILVSTLRTALLYLGYTQLEYMFVVCKYVCMNVRRKVSMYTEMNNCMD